MEGRVVSAAADELTCQELVELITEYLEGTLPAAERARFEVHLAGCTGCRNYLAQMRGTLRTLGHLRDVDISPTVRDELLVAFRAWRQP